jgi:carbamoyltransferase
MKSNVILSLCLSGHGFSGAVCLDGEIIIATSLERITRVKNDLLLPLTEDDLKTFGWKSSATEYVELLDLPFNLNSPNTEVDFKTVEKFQLLLNYLLDNSNLTLEDVNTVVYSYRYVDSARKFFSSANPKIDFIVPEHHFSHACQAFLSSPFEESAILVLDGQGVPLDRTNGDQLSGCLAVGKGIDIQILEEFPVRISIGGMYADFTRQIGFETNQEGKTMGLAPYGSDSIYRELREKLVLKKRPLSLQSAKNLLHRRFKSFEQQYTLPNYSKIFKSIPRRSKNDQITNQHMNLAYAVQELTEDVMIYLANIVFERTGIRNLSIAGGVGLNCVANYQVLINCQFDKIFVHPNPGDNGLVIGQALYVYHILQGNPRKYVAVTDSLGKQYSDDEIREAIRLSELAGGIQVEEYSNLEEMYDTFTDAICEGKITSWFQGKSEFGPRALGNRSILADPRRSNMKDILNSRVKFRESFRPFTPSVLAEHSSDFFDINIESPFMLFAAYVKKGKAELVPAITHVDNTARVQTVTRDVNERYYDLIEYFYKKTGIPMLLDTSFNVAGEPIVETPIDALNCFRSTDIDLLCIGDFIIRKV